MSNNHNRRWSTLSALVLAILVLSGSPAGASCGPLVSIEEAIQDAPFVFVGTVVGLEHDGRLASFSVEEVWRGEVNSRVVVSGGPTPSDLEGLGFGESMVTSVDRHFEQGVKYLVVAYSVEDGVYMDNACSATEAFGPSAEDLRPVTAHPPIDVGTDSDVVVARIALALVAVTAASGLAFHRIRRRAWPPSENAVSSL